VSPLNDDEKLQIVHAYRDLRKAVGTHDPAVEQTFERFQSAYHGSYRAFVDDFATVKDRSAWVGELGTHLREEIETEYWTEDLKRDRE
jgi:hypothetical protein